MSLIYDYLKIHGKSGSDKNLDVEIPPALKRRESSGPDKQSLLLILGSILVGALLIFLIVKIISPDQPLQEASGRAPAIPQQVLQSPAEISPPPEAAVPSAPETEALAPPAEVQTAEQQSNAAGKTPIQVFPETDSTFSMDTGQSPDFVGSASEYSGPVRKKMVQPLELESKARKITFPENAPLYSEPEPAAEPLPEMQKSNTAAKRPSAFSSPDKTSMRQGRNYYQAGFQAQLSGDQRIAEIYYRKALEQIPYHMDSLVNLSAIYVQQERYAEAEEILEKVLSRDPENSKALVNMGVISLYDNNEARAEKYFQAALDANPIEENALINLAYLAEKNRDFVSTERYYRYLLQITADNLEVLLAYGHLLEEMQRFPEAVALYADCLELDSVKKDRNLHDRISQRMRQLAGRVN